MGVKSKILMIGGTGYIGKHVTKASLEMGHPTFIFTRSSYSTPNHNHNPNPNAKQHLLDSFKSMGATILQGSLDDHESLIAAIKQAYIIISTLGGRDILEQEKIIEAIKEVGTVKRFLPSEFGTDVDHATPLELVKTMYGKKIKIRRAIEVADIPYTYISSNSFVGYSLASLGQPGQASPPREKVVIHGTGTSKVFVKEEDIGTYTIKAIDDPNTLNKTVYLRPPENIMSQLEMVALWEKKIGKNLEKVFISEEEMAKQVEDAPFPKNAMLGTIHNIFVKGDQCNFDIGPNGVEASKLYPEVKYTTPDEFLGKFL